MMRNFTSFWKKLSADFQRIDPLGRRNIGIVAAMLMILYVTYPIIRSVTQAFFLEAYGASKSPLVWLYSVLFLAVVLTLFNFLQKKVGENRLFFATTMIITVLFYLFLALWQQQLRVIAYPLFILKEAYIVLFVHMALGLFNSVVNLHQAKLFYGILGAIGGVGSIVGGILTTQLADFLGPEQMCWGAASSFLAVGGLFLLVKLPEAEEGKGKVSHGINQREFSPQRLWPTLQGVRSYVLALVGMIVCTQFVINLADFQFNLSLDQLVGQKEKVQYLGQVYGWIGVLTLMIQLLVVPWALRVLPTTTIHLILPSLYLALALFNTSVGGGEIFIAASVFSIFKSLDYSIFSAAKEILYFGLRPLQKYAAKYLVDIICYRAAKGVISFILIFYQSVFFINSFFYLSLGVWGIFVWRLVRLRAQLPSNGESS